MDGMAGFIAPEGAAVGTSGLTLFQDTTYLRGPNMELPPDLFRARGRALEEAFFA